MEYADVIWDNQKQNLKNKLENIQLDAARIVTGGTRLTSHDSLYEETKWEKLKDRRKNWPFSEIITPKCLCELTTWRS
jgi:hypothetical protein